jgi:predicted nucleotidyltransferase
MNYGLRDEVVEAIVGILSGEPRVEKVTLFGSRAKGTHREGSDIDICLTGPGLDLAALSPLETKLDDLLLPWRIDLVIFDYIDNQDMRDHIERVGIPLYERRAK